MTFAWEMFKRRGMEDLGLSTYQLKQARERVLEEQHMEGSESLRPISDEDEVLFGNETSARSDAESIAESIVRTNLIPLSHSEVLDNLCCSSSDNLDAVPS